MMSDELKPVSKNNTTPQWRKTLAAKDAENALESVSIANVSCEPTLNKRMALNAASLDAIMPLRVMACKYCKTIITRTAQPTTKQKDFSDAEIDICRTYDVQSWVVGVYTNARGEASRKNTWHDSWVWTYTLCTKCIKHGRETRLGLRFDWAPEERVDLSTSKITYMIEQQAMCVTNAAGSICDLTHVVYDGKTRHHHYGLFERELVEVHGV